MSERNGAHSKLSSNTQNSQLLHPHIVIINYYILSNKNNDMLN